MLPATPPTPEQIATAEAYRQWHAARWAAFKQQGYGGSGYRTTCSLCGDASDSQVCGNCAAHMKEHGL